MSIDYRLYVSLTQAQSIPANTDTAVQFNNLTYNGGGTWASPDFAVQDDGLYRISAALRYTMPDSNGWGRIRILRQPDSGGGPPLAYAVEATRAFRMNANESEDTGIVKAVLECSAGDKIRVDTLHSASVARSIGASGSGAENYLEVERLVLS